MASMFAPANVIASDELVTKTAALVREIGEEPAAGELAISRQTLMRLLARLPVRRGTLIAVEAMHARRAASHAA